MKSGKLDWDILKNIIDNSRGAAREEVRIRSGIGEDCSVVKFGQYECVLSTDPITGAQLNSGKLAVNINCNDVASCGVEPLGILVTILAPEKTELKQIKDLMTEISSEAKKLNVEILGGHTEVTAAVNKMIISCTVIGRTLSGKAVATSGAECDDDIIVTKDLCLEGTSIIANDYTHLLKDFLTENEINEAKKYMDNISVLKEGKLCGEFGVHSMHDITEGGILGAIWEVAEASKTGFEIFTDSIPLTAVSSKICNRFNIDPLRFISSGSMLITAAHGEKLIKILRENGIKATIIGKITKDKGILVNSDKKVEVSPPERDELFIFKERYK
ncbi:AIR synthase family protein [Clostridium sp. JN-9]|uniref:AIR synthase family protein n=1 Tax=Clostridium sp. JN-9 TaxID=2507159 RepID=UPI000FFE18FD|nr:AIR synthase family protein [Clostridium sp. JN-9]QAT39339.1 AIR synthase [Clostridium sp. JN-9]